MFGLTRGDLIFIVEDFLAEYFHFESVTLNKEAIMKLENIAKDYARVGEFIPYDSVRDDD